MAAVLAIAAMGSATRVVAQSGDESHRVQVGESLSSIAQRYGVSVDELRASNRISENNFIYVGQVLTVPGQESGLGNGRSTSGSTRSVRTAPDRSSGVPASARATPVPTRNAAGTAASNPSEGRCDSFTYSYQVQYGDTLSRISRRTRTSEAQLRYCNDMNSSIVVAGGGMLVPNPVSPPVASYEPQTRITRDGDTRTRPPSYGSSGSDTLIRPAIPTRRPTPAR